MGRQFFTLCSGRGRVRCATMALLAMGTPASGHAAPQSRHHVSDAGARQQPAFGRRALSLEQGQGELISLSRPASNIFVADPKVVAVRPASAHSLFVFGQAPGLTTIAVTDNAGRAVANFNVRVSPQSYVASKTVADAARDQPRARISASGAANGIVVRGRVPTPAQDYQIMQQAQLNAGKDQTVVNQTEVTLPQQVGLKVRIAQMSRTVTQQLGINWQSVGNGISIGRLLFGFGTVGNLLGASSPGSPSSGSYNVSFPAGGSTIDGVLDALNSDNLAHILAEPTLTALSGQSASFIDGGEFPVPVPGQNGQVTVQYKSFGVQLKFKPVVLSNGSIILHVEPTVSAPTTQNAFQLAVAGESIVVPSLSTQSASTTVVIGSGQTLAIAGLLSDSTNQTDHAVPGLGDIPVLGAAFRNDDFNRQEQELVILVTPYLVKPLDDGSRFTTPDARWTPADQIQRFVQYRDNGAVMRRFTLPAPAGFILR